VGPSAGLDVVDKTKTSCILTDGIRTQDCTASSLIAIPTALLLRLFRSVFHLEDRGTRLFRNVGKLPDFTMSHYRRHHYSELWVCLFVSLDIVSN